MSMITLNNHSTGFFPETNLRKKIRKYLKYIIQWSANNWIAAWIHLIPWLGSFYYKKPLINVETMKETKLPQKQFDR